VLTRRRIELDSTLVAFRGILKGSSNSENVTIRVPLNTLDEHTSVNENRHLVSETLHKLKSTALVSDAKGGTVVVNIFIAETLAI